MKIPFSWLQKFVHFPSDLSPQEIAQTLTLGGVETVVHDAGALSLDARIVVGEILTLAAHPNADRLQIASINVGDGTPRQIVTGATNVAVGQKIPVACHGAKLPTGTVIKRSKLRGIPSEGMLCSERELGGGEDAQGIWILPETAPVGMPLAEWMPPPDPLFELDVLPNRADLLSVYGVARELVALLATSSPERTCLWQPPSGELQAVAVSQEKAVQVEVAAQEACYRYMARVIRNVVIKPSPQWLQDQLTRAGIRPINNVVDITNYVLLLWGQPLHAFDLATLQGGKIQVRWGREGEHLTTLDGSARPVTPNMLVIADGIHPVALAGIMGGKETEITGGTQTILLESAQFAPEVIRKTSRQLGLRTESSVRFEKGVSWNGVAVALDQAAKLITELAEGSVDEADIDCQVKVPIPLQVPLRLSRLHYLLGAAFPRETVVSVLERLQFQITSEAHDPDRLLVAIPDIRTQDIHREVDLIEEVARVIGYDKIPAPPRLPAVHVNPALPEPLLFRERRLIQSNLVAQGFLEVVTTGFVDLSCYEPHPFLYDLTSRGVRLANPLSQDRAWLRFSLFPGLLETLQFNLNHGEKHLACFEMGRTFLRGMAGSNEVEEIPYVAGVVTGAQGTIPWDFFRLKGVLWNLFTLLKLPDLYCKPVEVETAQFFHPPRAARVLIKRDGEAALEVGKIGALHVDLVEGRNLPTLWGFELSLPALAQVVGKPVKHDLCLSSYPAVRRDLSLLLPDTVLHEDLVDTMKQVAKRVGGEIRLERIELWDLFSGKSIPAGQVSLTYQLVYRHPTKTLLDVEVNKLHDEVMAALTQKFSAHIRGKS